MVFDLEIFEGDKLGIVVKTDLEYSFVGSGSSIVLTVSKAFVSS